MTMEQMIKVYMENMVKLYCTSISIVSDRDASIKGMEKVQQAMGME